MTKIIGCIVDYHNFWLVLLAAMLCLSGSWVTARLFLRMAGTVGGQRYGWLFMTALAAGVAIWCRGQNKVCSKSCAKLERTLNITRRGGFFWQVARA